MSWTAKPAQCTPQNALNAMIMMRTYCAKKKTEQNFNLAAVFEVLTAVVMKSSTFWYITPFSPLEVNRHFGGTFRLHLQGRRINQAC
jgi:hypothetical protein